MNEWLRRSFKEGVAAMAPIPPRAQELQPRNQTNNIEWELNLEASSLRLQLAAKEASLFHIGLAESMNDQPGAQILFSRCCLEDC